jgi:Domain of unknown function (DUF1918)
MRSAASAQVVVQSYAQLVQLGHQPSPHGAAAKSLGRRGPAIELITSTCLRATARRDAELVRRLSSARTSDEGGIMAVEVGKRVVAESESTDRRPRSGVIEEVLRGDPSPRYRIRWDDGHESIYTLFDIGIDEVSWKRQHNYLTLVADHLRGSRPQLASMRRSGQSRIPGAERKPVPVGRGCAGAFSLGSSGCSPAAVAVASWTGTGSGMTRTPATDPAGWWRSRGHQLPICGSWRRTRSGGSACRFAFAFEECSELGDRAHQRRGEHDGGVLVDGDLDEGLEVAQL